MWFAGRHEKARNLNEFTKLPQSFKTRSVTCGWDVTAVLSEDNRLFVWGSNLLGISEKGIIKQPTQLHLPDNEIPIDVKFGLKFIAILTKSQKLFITGMILRPFLKSPLKNFSLITHNSNDWLQADDISHFACGQNHVSYVTNDGHSIDGIGDNKFQQCARIESREKIIMLKSGWTHVAYLTESKRLFLYGRNTYGQLGNGSRTEINTPHCCSIFPVEDFSLGAEHCILKSSDGRVYTFGWNEHRNCSVDSDDDVLTPHLIQLKGNEDAEKVIAGSGFSMVIS